MSAFVISTATMHRVVCAIDQHCCNHVFEPFGALTDSKSLDRLGATLFGLNADAVAQRYREAPEPTGRYRYRPQIPDILEGFMALSCLIYQCSEGDVPDRALYQAVARVRDQIANRIAHNLATARNIPWDWH